MRMHVQGRRRGVGWGDGRPLLRHPT